MNADRERSYGGSERHDANPTPEKTPARRPIVATMGLVLAAVSVYAGWYFISLSGRLSEFLGQTDDVPVAASSPATASAQPEPPGNTGSTKHFDPPRFDLTRLTISSDRIERLLFKDAIRALDDPRMIPLDEASFLKPGDRVIGVIIGTEALAYPLRILNYHEVVNDRAAGVPFAVTYCPLCDSSIVFDRRVGSEELQFGVTGMLYNSNVLLFNRDPKRESLWSQIESAGVSGEHSGQRLDVLPTEVTTFEDWKRRFPDSKVLSDQTGHTYDYSADPYKRYFQSPHLQVEVSPQDDRLPVKEPVLGVWSDNISRAYPARAFQSSERRQEIEDELDGLHLRISFNSENGTMRVLAAEEGLRWMYSFWFAWYAIRPETDVFEPPPATD